MCNAGQDQQAARDGSDSIDVDIMGMQEQDDADSQSALLGTLCLCLLCVSISGAHAALRCLSNKSAHVVSAQDRSVRKQVLIFLTHFDEASLTRL